jgi:hypothetical protein
MALQGKMTTGLNPRQLQEGLDLIIDENLKHAYYGMFQEIFKKVPHHKAYYEMQKLAGMGVAGVKGEGEAIQSYDSIDQHWVHRFPMITYEKSARITLEAQEYNLYMDYLPRIGKELVKAHKVRQDLEGANIFNDAFASVTYGDGKVLCANDHPLQAGGTVDNLISADFDEDAIEQMRILAYQMKNDDGIEGDYELTKLVYPVNLTHEVDRVLMSPLRPATADNDINVNKERGDLEKCMWKRLTDTDAFFAVTNADDGFILAEHMGIKSKRFGEEFTWDTVVSTISMWRMLVGDSARACIGSAGV